MTKAVTVRHRAELDFDPVQTRHLFQCGLCFLSKICSHFWLIIKHSNNIKFRVIEGICLQYIKVLVTWYFQKCFSSFSIKKQFTLGTLYNIYLFNFWKGHNIIKPSLLLWTCLSAHYKIKFKVVMCD